MKRFLFLLAAGTAISVGMVAGLPLTGLARAPGEIAWTASLYADKTRIAQDAGGRRVLVIGGSSTLFSFDAEQAKARFSLPVVNFGTHAGLGLDYILARADRVVRPGDTVILVIEYELLTQSLPASEHAIQMTAFYDRSYLDTLSWRERPQYMLGYNVLPSLLSGTAALLGRRAAGRTDVTFDQSGNARGNSVALSSNAALRNAAPGDRPVSADRVSRLRAFLERARENGVTVYAAPPAVIATAGYTAPKFRRFQQGLASLYARLGMKVIDPALGLLPPEDMYDSVYHANDRGRTRYTQRVVDAVCRDMGCQ